MDNQEWQTVDIILKKLPRQYTKYDHTWTLTYLPNKYAFVTLSYSPNAHAHYSVATKTWVTTHNFPDEIKILAERIVTGKHNKYEKEDTK